MAVRRAQKKKVASGEPGASLWASADERVREREKKRHAVILTAARAFRKHGYHNTSIDDVARELNVTKPTIYHYVQNKEQLLFECFHAGLGQIMEAFDEVKDSDANARERLSAVMKRYAEAITSEFGWCMVQAENQDLSAAMSKKVRALKSDIDHGIRRIIEEGARDGSIRKCDAKISTFALAGAMNWIAYWYRSDESLGATDIANRFIELFLLGLQPR
ncbi:MAG: TetR/AcrR family transcriptional regulator [Steroidobacteraceae bacterium]